MANPFLTSAPFDPRGGFGFQRPPVGGGYGYQPYDPFGGGGDIPGIGIDTPIGRVGICPPGTACAGTSVRILGQEICAGGCTAVGTGGVQNGLEYPEYFPPPPGNGEIVNGARPPGAAQCGGLCASGFHLNKAEYFLKNGVRIPARTKCVRNRRRNPLNPEAADRAIGRLRSASRFGKYLAKIDLPAKGTRKR